MLLSSQFSEAYRDARQGAPWYDNALSPEEARDYMLPFTGEYDFTTFAAVDSSERIIGAHAFFSLSLNDLEQKRGAALHDFTKREYQDKLAVIAWDQEIFVKQKYQGLGIARNLGKLAYRHVTAQYESGIILRRIRQDNIASVRMSDTAAFDRTGVYDYNPSYEYWYKIF